MKRILIYILTLAPVLGMVACYKDKGNYDYHLINDIGIAQFDTVKGYVATFGDTLSINPSLVYTLPNSTGDYSYSWSFETRDGDRVISTDKNLKVRIAELPGTYSLQYKVLDKATGVVYHARATLTVKTEVYEGYMVLNDVNGKARLDMLSYDGTAKTFTQYTDVLSKMKSSLPAQDQPYKVVCTRVSNAFSWSDSTYGIYLVTASGTNRIHPETFDWRPTYNIRYEVAGNIGQDFKASNVIPDPAFYYVTIFLAAGNNIYLRSGTTPIYNLAVNKYAGQPAFKAAPMAVSDGGAGYLTMYDMDKRAFAMLSSFTQTAAVPVPVASKPGEVDYPKGGDLLFMDKNASGLAFAVTQDPVSGTCYITKFTPGSLPEFSRLLKGTDIDKATQFALSANPDYLFYSVGGKLYEYDFSLEASKLMLDKGTSVISYLAFQKFTAATGANSYAEWARWLTVGSYNPAGAAGANGTLEQYAIVDANEPLIFKNRWTGFGKIVSTSYRERK